MKQYVGRITQLLGISSLALGLIIVSSSHTPEEGMFPLNYLNATQLKNAGLKLSGTEIFNPGEVSLTDALVKVGGCTGSFISSEGLIITNHHCVYGNVANLSTSDQNYLENGFVAKNKTEELPISMPCKITQSYEDVSLQVLEGINENTSDIERSQLIKTNIQRIVKSEKEKHPELSIEISEMFVGKSYTLFRYIFLQDVRLVMAPPVTVGQFGGDTDNWEWPRHNGDFSLVRAYVGKDGKPAPYNKENIPYTPKNTLKINPKGTQEGDFVFIMGYPGRTFRHESGAYLDFQQKVQLPTIQGFFKTYIDWMKSLSENDTDKRLKFASTIQWMENVEKNYRGKIQGLRRTDIVSNRISQDRSMSTSYSDAANAKKVIDEINAIWEKRMTLGETYFYSANFTRQSSVIQLADLIYTYQAKIEAAKKDKNKAKVSQLYSDFSKAAQSVYQVIDVELEKRAYKEITQQIVAKARKSGAFDLKTVSELSPKQWNKFQEDVLFKPQVIQQWLINNPAKVVNLKSKCYEYLTSLRPIRESAISFWETSELALKALMPRYISYREDYLKSLFIPDANSTLRLTYGYIKSYKPNDGEVHYPYTSLDGIFEKANTLPDYRLPKQVQDKLRQTEVPAIFKDPKTGKIVVGILYNLDTTGGNSGSPVLNDKGELIGINFDRSFTATINDYAWNENYSRSIGCDIRYVLYVLKYVSEADNLIKEMGVSW